MVSTWKYMLCLALALAAIYAYAPRDLPDTAEPRWVDDIGAIIHTSLASAKPEAEVSQLIQSPRRVSTRTWTFESPNG